MQPDERRYGVAAPEDIAGLTGREVLQAMIDGRLPAPPMLLKTLALIGIEAGDGFVVFEGEPGPQFLNPLGLIHGGWALTLIDT